MWWNVTLSFKAGPSVMKAVAVPDPPGGCRAMPKLPHPAGSGWALLWLREGHLPQELPPRTRLAVCFSQVEGYLLEPSNKRVSSTTELLLRWKIRHKLPWLRHRLHLILQWLSPPQHTLKCGLEKSEAGRLLATSTESHSKTTSQAAARKYLSKSSVRTAAGKGDHYIVPTFLAEWGAEI